MASPTIQTNQSVHQADAARWAPASWGTAAFIAVACTAVFGLEASHIISQRAAILDDGRKDTANLASSLVQQAELTFRTADALLIGTVERVEHDGLSPESQQRLKRWFLEEVKHSSEFVSFAIIDSNGAMVVNSVGRNSSANFADREHFIYHQTHADHELHISNPIRSRTADEWIIPATRRFNRADGSFGGVAVAAINPRYFQDLYDRFEIGSNGAILLASMSGNLLVRRPFVEANVGRDMSQSGIFKQLELSPIGSAEIVASTDGVRRINSYEQGKSYPLVVAVAKDVEELLAPWRESALRRIGEGTALIVLISVLGMLVWRTTDRLAAKAEKLRDVNARFDVAMNCMSQGLCLYDRGQRIVLANKKYAEIYRLTTDQISPGTLLTDIFRYRREQGTGFRVSDDHYFTRSPAEDSTETLELADGRMVSIARHLMPDGGWLAIHEDITVRANAERKIAHLARHDQLTGLPNRYEFSGFLEEAVANNKRSGDKIAVFMLDLDGFKTVNDTLGHGAGDLLLQAVAQRLKTCVRHADLVARLGGDEFAIIQYIDKEEREAAIALALRIIDAISDAFDLSGQAIHVGISIGISLCPEQGISPEDLIQKADLALYATKAAGKNDFRIYELSMSASDDDQKALERDMRQALKGEEFELHYQPMVDLATGDVQGMEALVRWRHPERGLLLPDQFISLAESTGLIIPLGEWILQKACNDAASWAVPLKVAVNISSIQLSKSNLFDVVLCNLVETGLAPTRLELEFNESVVIDQTGSAAQTIRQLSNIGVTMVIDDFGTGYSSASLLANFTFRKIKIDQSFVQGITDRRDCAAVVASVLALAEGLGIETTAAGIETVTQMKSLQAAGVTYGQGYYFGRPAFCAGIDPSDQRQRNTA